MATADINEIYTRHIRPLSAEDRKRLLALLTRDLRASPDEQKTRSLMELEGVGAELWEGVDAQEYVNKLREEWDHRP
jgi:hypothetical protein